MIMKKLILLLLFATHCFSQSVGYNVGEFAFDLNRTLDKPQENSAFSPYGIFSNLALVSYGAQGETAQQIQNAIHLTDTGERFLTVFRNHLNGMTASHSKGYQLDIANALFPHKGTHLLKSFEELAKGVFHAKLQSVDYDIVDNALKTINGYVSEKTRGKIPTIVTEDEVNKSTRLVVVNAVFFEGEWVHPFLKNKTKKAPFYPEQGQDLEVPTLSQVQYFPYYENDEIQCMALPFARHDTVQPFLECVIVLPKKGALSDIESTLTFEKLNGIIDSLDSEQVHVEIPKFCFSRRIELNDPLKALGMKLPFTYQADFSKIDGMRDLFLNTVVHETFFSLYEEGVTAAAATASSIGVTSAPPSVDDAIAFKANRPFLFYIVDYHSRAILFMGRCAKPEVSSCHEN